eukprot:scaffold8156_cov101-Cylindrotheca_fusiformis.AAC.3
MFWQTMFNLASTSESGDLHKLEGDIFSTEAFYNAGVKANSSHKGTIHLMQAELCVFYDLEAGAKRAIKDGFKFEKLCPWPFP